MKNNFTLQLSPGSNQMTTEQSPFLSIYMGNKISGHVNKFLPAKTPGFFGPVNTVTKIDDRERGLSSFIHMPLNLVAASLSKIELAIECYDTHSLRLSTHDLKNLFLNTKAPAVFRLAAQMEELAGQNRVQEVKELLREIKRIIGWLVKHRKQPRSK